MTETAVTAAKNATAVSTIGSLFRDQGLPARLAGVAPPGFDAARLVRQAAVAFRATPGLRATDPASVQIALCQLAELGLFLAGGEAYLIPRRSKKTGGMECTLQIGCGGWIKLALQTGRIRDIDAVVVYEADHFKVRMGSGPGYTVEHEPDFCEDRGRMKLAWAFAELTTGYTRHLFMPKSEILAAKAKADPNSAAWADFEAMMWRKVAIKRLARQIAMGSILLARAAALDGDQSEPEPIDVSDAADATAVAATDDALPAPLPQPAPSAPPPATRSRRSAATAPAPREPDEHRGDDPPPSTEV